MTLAGGLVLALEVYAALGAAFAVPFALRWAGRLDPAARRGTLGFRVLLLPGALILWPLLAQRVLRAVRAARGAARATGGAP
jgi:hypothetical protein